MRVPTVWQAKTLRNYKDCNSDVTSDRNIEYIPLRPEPQLTGVHIFERVRLAWKVFTGKCDAIAWSLKDAV